jgi:hypothetical protein
MDHVVWHAIGELKEFSGNPRRHPESQIAALMKSIRRVWTNPILIDEAGTILAGHGRLEAAKRLGMTRVPTVIVGGLTALEKQAIVIADNRLPERAVWDFDLLRGQFAELIEVNFDVELTGFSTGEIDLMMDGSGEPTTSNPADDLTGLFLAGPARSRPGDIWVLGKHLLLCGDALREESYRQLLANKPAELVVTDPPYNVPVHGC